MNQHGSGKTKSIIDLVKRAAQDENGNIVCIESKNELTYDIPYDVRLVQAKDYNINNYDALKGFLSGLHAGNFDISHIFIDGLFHILNEKPDSRLETFLDWCESFSDRENVKFTIAISSNEELATPGIKKYF